MLRYLAGPGGSSVERGCRLRAIAKARGIEVLAAVCLEGRDYTEGGAAHANEAGVLRHACAVLCTLAADSPQRVANSPACLGLVRVLSTLTADPDPTSREIDLPASCGDEGPPACEGDSEGEGEDEVEDEVEGPTVQEQRSRRRATLASAIRALGAIGCHAQGVGRDETCDAADKNGVLAENTDVACRVLMRERAVLHAAACTAALIESEEISRAFLGLCTNVTSSHRKEEWRRLLATHTHTQADAPVTLHTADAAVTPLVVVVNVLRQHGPRSQPHA